MKMRSMNVLKLFVIGGCAFGIGALVATSCIGVSYPTVAFRCNPRQNDNCPKTHFCCSDDPAAQNGELPDYLAKGIGGGIPIFSGRNNKRGTSGMCVRTEDIPANAGLIDPGVEGCPVPCNPTWTNGQKQTVCGPNRRCCQTVEITEKDCVREENGVWRPVTGRDIGSGGSTDTNWSGGSHDTHQDPGGEGCEEFSAGDKTIYDACVDQLSVADQRGFCMSLAPGVLCPTEAETYIDACEMLNGGGGGGSSSSGGTGDGGTTTGDGGTTTGDGGTTTGDGGTTTGDGGTTTGDGGTTTGTGT
jgi:hypothetical protein